MNLKNSSKRFPVTPKSDHDPDKIHSYHARGRFVILESAVKQAEAVRDFNAQHGKVKVLMVNGKPGPDAGGNVCT